MVTFHQTLSEESVYLRYAHLFKLSRRTTHERLAQICLIDYNQEMALVVETTNGPEHFILGIGRLSRLPGTQTVELSMLVSDCRQHQGIGTQLMHRLIAIARREQLSHIVAVILPGNRPMQKLCRSFGFVIEHDQLSEMMTATLDLTQVSEK